MPGNIPSVLLDALRQLEPSSSFSVDGVRITSSSGITCYGKTGSASEIEQYHGEAENLRAMYDAAPGLSPKLLVHGVSESGKPYMVSKYKFLSRLTSGAAIALAEKLATELHSSRSPNAIIGS